MNLNKTFDKKLVDTFNESLIFSTEVSSCSQLQKDDSSRNLFRISSKFKEEPHTYLKKIKSKSK